MKGPYKVIDCNRHVVEPPDLWEKRLRAVVWGSQYPLPDILHFFPHELQSIVEDRHLTDEAKRRRPRVLAAQERRENQ